MFSITGMSFIILSKRRDQNPNVFYNDFIPFLLTTFKKDPCWDVFHNIIILFELTEGTISHLFSTLAVSHYFCFRGMKKDHRIRVFRKLYIFVFAGFQKVPAATPYSGNITASQKLCCIRARLPCAPKRGKTITSETFGGGQDGGKACAQM